MLSNIDNSVSFTALNLKFPQNCKGHKKLQNVAKIIEPIVDTTNENLPSTVILCNKDGYKILRQGAIVL